MFWNKKMAQQATKYHALFTQYSDKYRAKYGDLKVSDAKLLMALEDENAKLKKLPAETMLDSAVLKDINAK